MVTITSYAVRYLDSAGDTVKAEFTDRGQAWAFMRLCDSHGVAAGYPHPVKG